MLTFTRLNIQGFCSIDSFSLQLNQDCTVLIKAPNGFGKSTLLNALVWALYGKNIKGVSEVNTWKEYQPKDYKGTMGEVFFQKNQDSYKVIRCQKFKELELRENQVEIFSISGNHDLKKVSFIGNKPFSWVKFLEQFGIVNLDYGKRYLGMNAIVYGIPYIDHNVGLSEYLKKYKA